VLFGATDTEQGAGQGMDGTEDLPATPKDGDRLNPSEQSPTALSHRRPSDLQFLVIPSEKVTPSATLVPSCAFNVPCEKGSWLLVPEELHVSSGDGTASRGHAPIPGRNDPTVGIEPRVSTLVVGMIDLFFVGEMGIRANSLSQGANLDAFSPVNESFGHSCRTPRTAPETSTGSLRGPCCAKPCRCHLLLLLS